jgi:hypothetical protein
MTSDLDPEATARDFHFEEYRRLIQEIQNRLAALGEFEKYAIVGMAAVYSWVLSRLAAPTAPLLPYVLWLPVAISALGLLRSYSTRHRIYAISEYVTEIETYYSLGSIRKMDALRGWETVMQPGRKGWRFYLPTSDPSLTWMVLLPLTFTIALWI